MERRFTDETTKELQSRLEKIETEAVEIRREISRRDRGVITRLQTQLKQLRVRDIIETVEAVPVQLEIPVNLRENRILGYATLKCGVCDSDCNLYVPQRVE